MLFRSQLPSNNQVGLTHYKRGCLPPPPSLDLLLSSFSLPFLGSSLPPSPISFSLSPCVHGQPLLLYSLPLSAFLCLYYPLNSPPHALNKLYSILYCHVAGPSGGKTCLDMGLLRHLPSSYLITPPHRTYPPPLSSYKDIMWFCNSDKGQNFSFRVKYFM